MITISTAECFTHGDVGKEIHRIAQDYEAPFATNYSDLVRETCEIIANYKNEVFDLTELSVLCSLFIPTLSAVKSILNISNVPKPDCLIKGIKVYSDEDDKVVALKMAQAVKKITGSDIGIGTTAGVGNGGIAIVTEDIIILTSSDISADLIDKNCDNLHSRQISGIEKTLKILIYLLNNDFDKINSFNDINIIR